MKTICGCLLWLLPLTSYTQSSSTGYIREEAAQAEAGFSTQRFSSIATLQQVAALAPNETLLQRDMQTFRTLERSAAPQVHTVYALRYFQSFGKRSLLSFNVGLISRSLMVAQNSYEATTLSVLDDYRNEQGTKFDLYRYTTEYISYQINSALMQLPLGLQISGNKRRRVRAQAGIEIAPGRLYNARYVIYQNITESTDLHKPNSSEPATGPEQENFPDRDATAQSRNYLFLNGYTFTAGLPLTLYFNITRRAPASGKLLVLINAQPYYMFTKFATLQSRQGFELMLSTGIRYRL